MNMMMIFAEDFISGSDNLIKICDDRRLTHLHKVLKVKVGKVCQAGLLNGKIGTAEVLDIGENEIIMRTQLDNEAPPKLPLTLVIAMQRPNTVKKIIHSAISVGVKKIIFIGCFKVEKSYWDSSVLQSESLAYEQLLALEQCVDTREIEIEFCRYFKDFLSNILPRLAENSQLLLAHPDKEENFSKFIDEERESVLFMGPEGGFTDYEVSMLKEAGAKQLSLGRRILRTEFAFTALAGRFLR